MSRSRGTSFLTDKRYFVNVVGNQRDLMLKALINSNVYISLAAVFLTIASQIQLGMPPAWHPYLFIIFFATLFEYNLHRLVTVLTNKEALNSSKHRWVKNHQASFYVLVAVSTVGFLIVAYLAKREVLIALAPIAVVTLFYSTPLISGRSGLFRLRQIPYLKIFLIAFVWSAVTILLPVIQADRSFDSWHVIKMLTERFIFIFAITIPFDIRDMEADRSAGLRTLALSLGERRAMGLSYTLVAVYLILVWIHYSGRDPIIWALTLSSIATLVSLGFRRLRDLPYYHYGILDGTMLLQGLLVYACSYLGG